MLAGFFDALPTALFEAARLDGASRLRTLTRVALPIAGPGLAATAIFNLAAYWSEFGLALVLLDSQSRFTMPLGLFALQSGYETEWQLVSAAALRRHPAGDGDVRLPAALFRRRPDGWSGERLTPGALTRPA